MKPVSVRNTLVATINFKEVCLVKRTRKGDGKTRGKGRKEERGG